MWNEALYGYVYFLELNGFYKIGSSTNYDKRYRQLCTGMPIQPKIEYVLKTMYYRQIEEALHRRFCTKRARGEWFNLDQADLDYIKTLDESGRAPDDPDYDGYPAQLNNTIRWIEAYGHTLK